jgi:diguanylate cyclase (GGDEF)-like protein
MSTGHGSNWSTQQLTEMLALVGALPADVDIVQRGLEHAVESLEGDVGAVVSDGRVVASLGYAAGAVPEDDLLRVARGEVATLVVPGAGTCRTLVVDCEGLPAGRMLVGRRALADFESQERSLFRGFARVLGLSLQARKALDHERELRVASERDAERHQQLLHVLRERQALLERLSRIQRSISTRRPLHEVLAAIVEGASELIGDEIAGLRIVDPDDPTVTVLAASVGLSPDVQEATRRSSVGVGVSGLAIRDRRLVMSESYGDSEAVLPAILESGVAASMAAPVLQGDEVVGSLLVATRRPGRRYTESEQEVLAAFAEHTGLALNDARTVAALQQAVSDATRQARQDALTGLANRTHFLDCLNAGLLDGRPVSVLFIDLDDFKLVNDTLGHPIGDALLKVVGERIVGSVRGVDVVARLGGDEFAVLLRSTPTDQAEVAAERIRQALSQPFHLPGHVVSIGASTGVVRCATDTHYRAEELLRDADVAMYRAKALGKGRTVLFADRMRVDLQARSRLERDLRQAVDVGELVAHFQPVIDVATGLVVGSEALLRWQHPELGLVPPSEFIPVAEETGLILEIGRQVLVDACTQTARWNDERPLAPWSVSVNVSARQLADGVVLDHVMEALRVSGLEPGLLTLELTESVLVQDIESAAGILVELKSLGVRLAIDDFGTRYSSLSYLARLPVDVLKVDRMFVADAPTGTSHARLAASVVALANSLQLQTVVEGVETSEQLSIMRRLGCRLFQGYLWSQPVPRAGFEEAARRIEVALAVPRPRGAEQPVRA